VVRAKVSVGLSGKPLPRPFRWVSACADMTFAVGFSGEPATFMIRTELTSMAMRFGQSTRSGTP